MSGKRVAVYVRPEDEEIWRAIPNKSQWVRDMLNNNETDLDRRIRKIAKEEAQLAIAEARGE